MYMKVEGSTNVTIVYIGATGISFLSGVFI